MVRLALAAGRRQPSIVSLQPIGGAGDGKERHGPRRIAHLALSGRHAGDQRRRGGDTVGQAAHQLKRHQPAARIANCVNSACVGQLAVDQVVDQLADKSDIVDSAFAGHRLLAELPAIVPAMLDRFRINHREAAAIAGGVKLGNAVVLPIDGPQAVQINHQRQCLRIAWRPVQQRASGDVLMLDRKPFGGAGRAGGKSEQRN